MNRTIGLLALAMAAMLSSGCQNPAADPYGWMDKWDQAGRGEYDSGPASASYDATPPRTPHIGGYNPAMYVGWSTMNNVSGTLRDDSLAGTYRFPASYGAGTAAYGPTTRTLKNGAGVGVRSTVVPPR